MFYGASTHSWGLHLAVLWPELALMTLGAERIASGLLAKGVKRSSRLLNIGVGVGIIIYIGSGFFYPAVCYKMAYHLSRVWFTG